ncbi:MurR/RpiR family transcriptional regulator [Bacillus sp. V5-8f]|uniref:MurR/RpiR family transcriptional regulator n=1 Tax=Bacillus sp. V5-8f TaxID=2053044 RepID=UPI000C76490B|nr:MurR/RpiR family transcriptional regulator [Bacillus sp. V5-8f]PLT33387.1 MurR/RpiR family transcriptional regulator [Bacillus sp. V5-8f]
MDQIPFKSLLKERFSRLSAGQQKVASYLIEHPDEAAFKAAFQIGRKAEVSETTVIRFAYALGFEGFSEMQESIRKQLIQKSQRDHSRERSVGVHQKENPFAKVIENQIHILNNLLGQTNVEDIWKTVDALIEADQILIAGQRISYTAAYWFSYTLSSIREHVSLCSPSGDFLEKACNLTKKSAIVVFSFPRYANETIKMAEFAKEQGIRLIAVTDRLLSPVGRISDIVLTTEENVETGTNSIASVISLLDLVIAGIHEKDHKRIHRHQQRLEKLYSSYEVFKE